MTLLLISSTLIHRCVVAEEFTVRRYSYVYRALGWVLQVDISTVIPWISGSTAHVNVSIRAMEYVRDSMLSVTSLTISTGNVSVSRYVGSFTYVDEVKEFTMSLPVVEPGYTAIKPGESMNAIISIQLDGYVEDVINRSRSGFSGNFSFPIVVSSPPSTLMLSVDSPKTVEADAGYFQVLITVTNIGSTPAYNTYLVMYINGSLYRAIYLRTIEQNNVTKTRVLINVDKPGVYLISAIANYTTPTGAVGHSLAYAITVVKSRPEITISSSLSTTSVFTPVEIRGLVSVPLNDVVTIEISRDSIEWWGLSTIFVEGNSFRYVWVPNNSGTYMLRASIPESYLYLPSRSNIIFITVERTSPKIQLSGNVVSGSQIRLSIQLDPKVQADVDIMYRLRGDQTWRRHTLLRTDGNGRGDTVFTALQPGVYEFKAVINENNVFTYAESNVVAINIEERTTTATQQQITTPALRDRNIMIIIIALSSVIAALLLFLGRRR